MSTSIGGTASSSCWRAANNSARSAAPSGDNTEENTKVGLDGQHKKRIRCTIESCLSSSLETLSAGSGSASHTVFGVGAAVSFWLLGGLVEGHNNKDEDFT